MPTEDDSLLEGAPLSLQRRLHRVLLGCVRHVLGLVSDIRILVGDARGFSSFEFRAGWCAAFSFLFFFIACCDRRHVRLHVEHLAFPL